jgi:hypothetical protein
MSFPIINIYTSHCGCGSGKTIVSCGCPKAKQYTDPVQTLPSASVPCNNGSEACPISVPWGCALIDQDMPDQGIVKGDPISKLFQWILQAMNNVGLNPTTLPPLAAPPITALTSNKFKVLNVTFTAVPNATSYTAVVREYISQDEVGRFPVTAGLNNLPVMTTNIDYEVQIIAHANDYSDSVTSTWSQVTAGQDVPQVGAPVITALAAGALPGQIQISFTGGANASRHDIQLEIGGNVVGGVANAIPGTYTIALNQAGDDVDVAVIASAEDYTNNQDTDTVFVNALPVIGLVAANVTNTTADINWTALGGASEYRVVITEVGVGVFATYNNVAAATKALVGLTTGTIYSATVYAENADGTVSNNGNTIVFKTT